MNPTLGSDCCLWGGRLQFSRHVSHAHSLPHGEDSVIGSPFKARGVGKGAFSRRSSFLLQDGRVDITDILWEDTGGATELADETSALGYEPLA